MDEQRNCTVCGGTMEGKRSGSMYCGPKCKQAAHRATVTDGVTDSGATVTPVTDSLVEDVTDNSPQSMNRKSGPIPGDPDYTGVALQGKYRDHWRDPDAVQFRPDDEPGSGPVPLPLPDYVPASVKARYNRGEPEYMRTINRLLQTDSEDLKADGVFIPMWRYQAHAMA